MRHKWFLFVPIVLFPVMAACVPLPASVDTSTPTVDPDIYNRVPDTTVYEPGACMAVLEAPAPAYTSNTLGGEPSGEIPAGQYEVGVAADYGSSVWFMLSDLGETNWVNSTSVSALAGTCAANNPQ